MNAAPNSWQEAAYEVYAGIHVGLTHVIYFGNQFLVEYVNRPLSEALGINVGKKARSRVASRKVEGLQVVGVGFGRTGTVSSLSSNGCITPNSLGRSLLLYRTSLSDETCVVHSIR